MFNFTGEQNPRNLKQFVFITFLFLLIVNFTVIPAFGKIINFDKNIGKEGFRILKAGTDAFELMENDSPYYFTAICYDSGTYRTIGASHELGGLGVDADAHVQRILQFFEFGGFVPEFNILGLILVIFGFSALLIVRKL